MEFKLNFHKLFVVVCYNGRLKKYHSCEVLFVVVCYNGRLKKYYSCEVILNEMTRFADELIDHVTISNKINWSLSSMRICSMLLGGWWHILARTFC